ncbi:MAG: hypothetical protein Kow0040_28920 [Thermogutta sp.]
MFADNRWKWEEKRTRPGEAEAAENRCKPVPAATHVCAPTDRKTEGLLIHTAPSA